MLKAYVIVCPKRLEYIQNCLNQSGGYVAAESIFRSPQGRLVVETRDKTRVICKETTICKLTEQFKEFEGHIEDYDWETFPDSKSDQHETNDLHISHIPNDFQESEAIEFIQSQLNPLISSDKYELTLKLSSRSSGEVAGHGTIKFAEDVDHYTRKLCKLILHNKPVASKSNPRKKMVVRCTWHKTQINFVKSDKTKKYKKYTSRPKNYKSVDVSNVGVESVANS